MKFNRRLFISSLITTFTAINLNFAKSKKPNIVLIIADDMRFDAIGAYPNKDVYTPYIDKLKNSGINFINNFTTTPICPSSRASIVTGRTSNVHKVWDFKTPPKEKFINKSLPKILKKNGYQTGFVGKWGIAGITSIQSIFNYFNGFFESFHYFLHPIN